MLVATAIAGLAVAAVVIRGSTTGSVVLPATPTAWLDAFSAGVARDSGDVCGRLLSPEFRAAMERDAHESCAAYYASAQVLSIRVLRILRLGATAAIEIRYFPRAGTRRSCSTGRRPVGKRSRLFRAARCRSPDAAARQHAGLTISGRGAGHASLA